MGAGVDDRAERRENELTGDCKESLLIVTTIGYFQFSFLTSLVSSENNSTYKLTVNNTTTVLTVATPLYDFNTPIEATELPELSGITTSLPRPPGLKNGLINTAVKL